MTNIDHARARELMLDARIQDIHSRDGQWLDAHLASCAECSEFATSLDNAIAIVRLPAVMAGTSLVRATQMRVRHRAVQLQSQAAAMRPLWVAVAMVCAWATVTTPLLWAGFAWLGAAFSLSNIEWRTGFLFAWIAPTLTASLLLLGTGSHRARWRMALGQNSGAV
jgi:hypothetical protein